MVAGEYDYVGIFEAEDEAAGSAHVLATISKGMLHTQSLRAYTVQEFAEIVKKIP